MFVPLERRAFEAIKAALPGHVHAPLTQYRFFLLFFLQRRIIKEGK